MQADVLGVVDRVSKTVVSSSRENVHPFQDLLETLLEQVRKVAYRFNSLAENFNNACRKHEVSSCYIQPSDIWNTVQAVVSFL